MDVPVRVFGGERPIFVEPMPIRNGRYALVGSLGGAAILAAGVWLAAAPHPLRGPKGRTTVVTLAPPPPRKLVLIPMVGGDGASAPLPAQEVTPPPLLRPFRRPVLTGAHHGSSPTRGRGDRSAPSPQQPQQPKEPDEHSLLDGIGATLDRVTDLVGGR